MRDRDNRISRCVVLFTTLVVAAIMGCRDHPTAPLAREIASPRRLSFDLGDPQNVTVPVTDPTNDSGSATMPTRYSSWTYATIAFSGMITQQQNFGSHASVQFGPAGLAGSCGGLLRIDFDSGGGSWWPSTGCTPTSAGKSLDTVTQGVKGLGKVSRGPGPTSCDTTPPCFTYSGSQSVTITPISSNIQESVNYPRGTPGLLRTFKAAITVYVPSGFWGVTEWRWIPDSGSSVVECVGYGPTCWFAPTLSGTMQVTATVNGVVRTATVRAEVNCGALTGPPGDSAFLRIANDTMTRALVQLAWDSSRATGPIANRLERRGYWGINMSGQRAMDFNYSTTGSTPCRSSYPPHGLHLDSILESTHVHPFGDNDTTPTSCHTLRPLATGFYDGHSLLGPSPDDFHDLAGFPKAWGVVADSDGIAVFQTPSSMTFQPVVYQGDTSLIITSDWTPFVRRYPRSQTSCSIY